MLPCVFYLLNFAENKKIRVKGYGTQLQFSVLWSYFCIHAKGFFSPVSAKVHCNKLFGWQFRYILSSTSLLFACGLSLYLKPALEIRIF